jgi:hypothetical protein
LVRTIAIRNGGDRGATSKPTDACVAAVVDANPEEAVVAVLAVPTALAQQGATGFWLALAQARSASLPQFR